MNAWQPVLERLADVSSVLRSYDDVFGVAHPAEPATIRRVLGALGVDAATDDAARRAVEVAERAAWQRALEPVAVLDGAALERSITYTHRADAGGRVVVWDLQLESGERFAGTFVPSTLPLLERGVVDGIAYERRRVALVGANAAGYYRFSVRDGSTACSMTVVVAPHAAYRPPNVAPAGVWGLAVQLYGLRSERNWGIGDFEDLRALCAIVRAAGGAAIGLNPLHDVRLRASGVPSPYSPSSRSHVAWIYLAIDRLPGYSPEDVDRDRLVALRTSEFVDYAAVAEVKREAARRAFARFRSAPEVEQAAFDDFVAGAGTVLRHATVFAALSDYFADPMGPTDWATWPVDFRDPATPAVATFASDHADDVAFYAYLAWQADVQLGRCAREARMPIGLYRDLAVGADLGGCDTWALRQTLTRELAVGAPPDLLNTRGQNWGVAPFHPQALREAAYEPFAALLRANMRHAGALRIDHVMALARLYLVPNDADATAGAYVAYRLDELLGIIALESVRAGCMVIGEDLGTVPEGFRERLAERGILSYRLLQFETSDDGFVPPHGYPAQALVSVGTHDLPPMAAYWTATDIATRAALKLIADESAEQRERDERARRREQLLRAFDADGERTTRFRRAADTPEDAATLAQIALAANQYLAATPSLLLMVQLEDVLGQTAQINVPTTTDEHPNWRRRAGVTLEALPSDPRFVALARALHDRRA